MTTNSHSMSRSTTSMTAQAIDGRKLADDLKAQVRGAIEVTVARIHRCPALAVVKVSDNPCSPQSFEAALGSSIMATVSRTYGMIL